MALGKIKSFYDMEIALMEHELIKAQGIGDFRPEDLQMYIMGVHDMADQIILAIRAREEF